MYLRSDAIISDCNLYRYLLSRQWDSDGKWCMFIGLNPSTADAYEDDPTIRRCVGFAKRWDCCGMYMMNAYAFRATDPKVMKASANPVGDYCDDNIKSILHLCKIRVACWGAHIETWRQSELKRMVPELMCFGLTKDGFPKHPLYLPNRAELVPFK